MLIRIAIAMLAGLLLAACGSPRSDTPATVIDVARLFDGEKVIENARMVIVDGNIVAVGERGMLAQPEGMEVIDYGDAFIMPGLIAGHSHVGSVSGTEHGGRFYSRETVARDLAQFQRYGVVAVNALGLNRPLFHELRQEMQGGGHGGADLYGAGAGVGAIGGAPPEDRMGVVPDQAYRPNTPEEARQVVREMTDAGVDMIKIWVDPMSGSVPPMSPEIYGAAIEEAKRLGRRTAAHIHDLEDAKGVLRAGVEVIAHGVRDVAIDQEFIDLMRQSEAWYVPTINIDEANYIYAEHPEWLDDPFFRAALSPEMVERIGDAEWRNDALANAASAREAVRINTENLRRLHAAGVRIAFGTDSGATAVRLPGFAEHRELELMVQAGMSPIEALNAATFWSARMLGLGHRGHLVLGSVADFLVLSDDPTVDIRNTRSLREVWRNGRKVVDHGPGG